MSAPSSSSASAKRSLDDEVSSSSSSSSPSVTSVPCSTPRKRVRTGPSDSSLPTPSPQKNSPFPRSALASSSTSANPSPSKSKRVTFDASLPPVSPHLLTPKKQFSASLLFPARSPTTSSSLPDSLHDLHRLHVALSATLTVHLARNPPHAPERTQENKRRNPHGFEPEEVEFRAVARYEGQSGIRELVEDGAGLKFPVEQLKRLFWLYEWDGEKLPGGEATSSRTLTPGRVGPSSTTTLTPGRQSATPATGTAPNLLSLTLSPTRTLARTTREQTHTYAFNLTIPVSAHLGGVVGAVARWTSKQEDRSAEVLRRLERWSVLCAAERDAKSAGDEADGVLVAKARKYVPIKQVVPLPNAAGGFGDLLATGRTASVSLANAPPSTLRKNLLSTTSGGTPSPSRVLSFGAPEPATSPATPTKSGSTSVAAKRQSMRDRMLAKEAAASSSTSSAFLQTPIGLGDPFIDASVLAGRNTPTKLLLDRDELRRKSILSRLANVAEGVFLLFTASEGGAVGGGGGAGMPASPSGGFKRKALPMEEVAAVVLKSAKGISLAEAHTSLTLLTQLCPFFLRSIPMGTQTYLEMPASAAVSAVSTPTSPLVAPSSPGSKFAASMGMGTSQGGKFPPPSPGKTVRLGGGGVMPRVREAIRVELERR